MTPRLTYAQRKERIEAKIARFQAGGGAGKSRVPILPFCMYVLQMYEMLTVFLTAGDDE